MPDNTIHLQVTITAEAEVTKAADIEAQEENEDER